MPGFDYSESMRSLCDDIVRRSPAMSHVDLSRVAVAIAQSRKPGRYGMWASLTPLRFEGGSREGIRRGRRYRCQRVMDRQGREMLYILSFYLPRFADLSLSEKLTTVFHELWHISPDCNGDIRRFEGRCFAHTRSEREYDAAMKKMAEEWLSLKPPRACYEFLESSFGELSRRFGAVCGARLSHPKLIPM